LLVLVGVGVDVADEVTNGTEDELLKVRPISALRDDAYSLGKFDKSLDCQYTSVGAAVALPEDNTVGLLKRPGLQSVFEGSVIEEGERVWSHHLPGLVTSIRVSVVSVGIGEAARSSIVVVKIASTVVALENDPTQSWFLE
jgi:hypothetical protein